MAVKPRLCSRKKTAAECVDPTAFVYLARGGQFRGTFGQKSKVAGLKSPTHEATEARKPLPASSPAEKRAAMEKLEKGTHSQLQSPLFKFPPEIRNKIYEYCADVCMRQDGSAHLGTCKYPALLKACKRIAQEALTIILSSEVEIRVTRLGMFYKTVGPFIPANVRSVRMYHHELVNPYLLTISLERLLRDATNIESARLTTYTRNLHEVTAEYHWERPKNLKKEQHSAEGDETLHVENSHLLTSLPPSLAGTTGRPCMHPHHKWMVIQFQENLHRVRSFDMALNLAIRRQDEWRCVYRSEKLEGTFADTLKREADILAKSENLE
ncbi:hypothetical protein PG994_008144 [Apiospora phragmitis]|uniref:Uncharacterized protein n=1 Tax=Apiospora phragmitis TaxID=2905665 RepID=A0ABR1US82_9PEZI